MMIRSLSPRVDRGDSEIPTSDPIARPGASGTVELNHITPRVGAHAGTAAEMSVPWKSQNDFHRPLEISHSTRDSHISTAASRV